SSPGEALRVVVGLGADKEGNARTEAVDADSKHRVLPVQPAADTIVDPKAGPACALVEQLGGAEGHEGLALDELEQRCHCGLRGEAGIDPTLEGDDDDRLLGEIDSGMADGTHNSRLTARR